MAVNPRPISIAPSLLCADLLRLGQQLNTMDEFHPYWYHIDIMDGHFVPNFGFGPDFVKAVKSGTPTPIITHLMCAEPENFIQAFAAAGADCISFPIEAARAPIRLLNQIHALGKKAGIVINPTTPLDSLLYIRDHVDAITVMAIEPGFAGQTFIEFTYERIRKIREIMNAGKNYVAIEVDGGVNGDNGAKSIACGADILVAGYFSVFKQGRSISENYREFLKVLENMDI
jgi:ribulose-phosphate 3-epimerase